VTIARPTHKLLPKPFPHRAGRHFERPKFAPHLPGAKTIRRSDVYRLRSGPGCACSRLAWLRKGLLGGALANPRPQLGVNPSTSIPMKLQSKAWLSFVRFADDPLQNKPQQTGHNGQRHPAYCAEIVVIAGVFTDGYDAPSHGLIDTVGHGDRLERAAPRSRTPHTRVAPSCS
jgi:hypothetical protein